MVFEVFELPTSNKVMKWMDIATQSWLIEERNETENDGSHCGFIFIRLPYVSVPRLQTCPLLSILSTLVNEKRRRKAKIYSSYPYGTDSSRTASPSCNSQIDPNGALPLAKPVLGLGVTVYLHVGGWPVSAAVLCRCMS